MLLAALTGLTGFRRDGVTLALAAWMAAAPQFLWIAFLLQGLCVVPRDGWENPVRCH
jgi:hypothetical protein